MADNTVLNTGSGGDTIATDDIGGVKHQRVKIQYGTDGSATDVSDTNPLPIDDAGGSLTVDNSGTFVVQIDGDALTALQLIDDAVAAEGDALGKGVLLQGDDGTDRTNVLVDTSGHLQVDVLTVPTTTVTGTVTANLSATDNAVLDNIQTAVETIDNAISGNEMQVDVITMPTTTVQGTITANLSAIDNAVLDNIQTAVETIDNAISGSEMQVDIVSSAAIPVTDNAGSLTVDDGGSSLTIDGTVTANLGATDNAVLDDIAAKLAPNTTNGHSFYLNQDTNSVSSVKASAGTIYWIACMSTDATPVYLNLYNVASGSVTLGTTTPDLQFIVPSQGDGNGSGFTINFGSLGIQFDTAITVAAATTFNGSTDPGANVVITNIGYE